MKKRQPHKNIPPGYFEEEQGQGGFYGPVSHLIKKTPGTGWTNIEGSLKPRMFDLRAIKGESWKKLLYNDFLNVHFYCVSDNKPQTAFRSADGDLLCFCHEGEGVVLTEYGLLKYSPGRYVLIPKCFTHVFIPEKPSSFFIVESLKSHFREPERGLLGRNSLYSSGALVKPDLKALHAYLKKRGLKFNKITVYHQAEMTVFNYGSCVFSTVADWLGDLFPFTLDMDDIMPVMSHRVHLPPSVHTTFLTNDFIVCSFLPRPLEQDKDALKVPFYHQNTDYDEVIFYHKGDFFSRDHLHPGMMSLHPAGFPHGPHPKAIKAVKEKTQTNEYALMLDSRHTLHRTKDLLKCELKSYWKSWRAYEK